MEESTNLVIDSLLKMAEEDKMQILEEGDFNFKVSEINVNILSHPQSNFIKYLQQNQKRNGHCKKYPNS